MNNLTQSLITSLLSFTVGICLASATTKCCFSSDENAMSSLKKYATAASISCIAWFIFITSESSELFSQSTTTSILLCVFSMAMSFVHYYVVTWNPQVKDFFGTLPPNRLSSAGETCCDISDGPLPPPTRSLRIKSGTFYSEYHSHKIKHLQTLKAALSKQGCDSFIYLCGDSSLDNKHWFFNSQRSKTSQMNQSSFTAPAINGYEDVLHTPSRMVKDVCYHMNNLAAQRFGRGHVCTIMSSIEESTIEDRFTAKSGLLIQDRFIADNITINDRLIVSVGGNDIALSPTIRTVVNMAMLTRSPEWMIRCGVAPGFGYFVNLFQVRIEEMIVRILSGKGQCPTEIIICMLYYPDVVSGGSWADQTLRLLGYDENPVKLQLIIKKLFESIQKRGFLKLTKMGAVVSLMPLFEVLTEHEDYVQRVEPSVKGGEKMAEAFLTTLFGEE